MATEDAGGAGGAGDGQTPAVFSWLEPHPLFCIILVGENEEAFGIQKDFLIAKSAHFRKYFAEKKEQQVEEVIRFPDTDPVVFGLAQLFMFTGNISTAPQPLPSYDLLIAVWKLGNELGIDGLCDESLKAMGEYRAATNSIPATELLVKAWNETPEGSPIRTLLLSWTAEYIRSSESRAEFTKSLPQEVLSELVVAMSHLNSAQAVQATTPTSPSTQYKNVHYLDHDPEERDVKAIKHRHSDVQTNRVKKVTSRSSLPPAPKPPKMKRSNVSINVNEDGEFSQEHKLIFCADLLKRIQCGPGFWTRLNKDFREPVKPIEDGVPDYFDKIKKPMDLSTIRKKMDHGEYSTAEEFEADFKLIYANCYAYWGPEAQITQDAEKFQKSFVDKYAEMNKWLSKRVDNSEAA
ncbi:putative Bromodomain testis-specific protein [Xylariaceae sp. FL1651]|nr:putative Bromodomain testis-specific protein [Xylariaceae sp. FL1651]